MTVPERATWISSRRQQPCRKAEWTGLKDTVLPRGPMPQLKKVAAIQLLPIFPGWVVDTR